MFRWSTIELREYTIVRKALSLMRAAIEPIELHNYGFSPSFIRGYRGARDQDSIRQMQARIPTVRRKTSTMTRIRTMRWLLSSLSFPILVATLYAQNPNGTIVGRVTDSTGAVVRTCR